MKIYIKKIILMFLFSLIIGIILIIILFTNNKVKDTNETKVNNIEKTETAIVLKDNYFITQLNDIYYNMNDYIDREIEIEGFPMKSDDGTTFVGRYGPGCCSNDGYAYIEYMYNEPLDLVEEKDWIKVKGKIKKTMQGNETYIYILATSVEKLSVRGIDRVTN